VQLSVYSWLLAPVFVGSAFQCAMQQSVMLGACPATTYCIAAAGTTQVFRGLLQSAELGDALLAACMPHAVAAMEQADTRMPVGQSRSGGKVTCHVCTLVCAEYPLCMCTHAV
jgi:hypothetical protein